MATSTRVPPLTAKPKAVVFQPLPGGFLRCTYGTTGALANIATVRSKTKRSEGVGMQLYFLGENGITFKSLMGLSGAQFSGGVVRYGSVYDDDGPPDPGRRITQAAWLAECLGTMAGQLKKS